ncbi:hypothetical protein SAMN05443245_5241 [Paraburkholderia fungorum]|uniref:Scaffolding protein n=1 Tax=Paraburkholderia fungorum TaxID=134537 RepID=A0A1H1IIU8_9BURK|nr:hypothetical protein [Paraburkholderia fungorum]SDR37583.1 hypothetical protein SAMN05443245_5241 [Paraburkholderia fungorum]
MPNLLRQLMLQTRLMSPEGDDPAGGGGTPPVVAPVQGKEVFSREYVQELRQENASYRTRANDAERKAQEAETKALKAQEEADAKAAKAASDADAKVQETHTAADQRIIRAELKAEAIKAGMVDLDGLKLADLSAVKIDEKGDVVGAEDMLKALKEAKPYLFKEATSSSNPGTPPAKEKPKPFDARTATPEERKAEAKRLGISIKEH